MNEYCENRSRAFAAGREMLPPTDRLAHWTGRRVVGPVVQVVREGLRRRRERRELLRIDEHGLHDIGLTIDDVLRITGATARERDEHLGLAARAGNRPDSFDNPR